MNNTRHTLAFRHDGSVLGGVPDIVQHDRGHGGSGDAGGRRAQCVAKAAEIPEGHAYPGVRVCGVFCVCVQAICVCLKCVGVAAARLRKYRSGECMRITPGMYAPAW